MLVLVPYVDNQIEMEKLLVEECKYTKKYMLKVKLNESSWNYFRGMWNKYKSIGVVHDEIKSL